MDHYYCYCYCYFTFQKVLQLYAKKLFCSIAMSLSSSEYLTGDQEIPRSFLAVCALADEAHSGIYRPFACQVHLALQHEMVVNRHTMIFPRPMSMVLQLLLMSGWGRLRAFTARSHALNYLLPDLRQPDLSYSHFRQLIKTFLFCQWSQSTLTALLKSSLLAYLVVYILTYIAVADVSVMSAVVM